MPPAAVNKHGGEVKNLAFPAQVSAANLRAGSIPTRAAMFCFRQEVSV
jgi:hypothetical protein